MPRFDNKNIEQLKDYLHYHCCAHDAIVEKIEYKWAENQIVVNAKNLIYGVEISLTFCDVKVAVAINKHEYDNRETVQALVVKDLSCLQNYVNCRPQNIEDSIYLLLAMFSNDEWHIVSGSVTIEIA